MKMVLTTKDIIPHGVKCVVCNKVAKPGQWVAHKSIPGVMHLVIHRAHLMELHDDVDEDSFDASEAIKDLEKQLISMGAN